MTENEYIKYNDFLLKQIELNQQNKIEIAYRGDNLKKIYKRFGIIDDKTEYNKQELLKRIFLIGDKSKYFYSSNLLNFKESPDYIALDNNSENEIEKIFNYFNNSTKSKKEYIINFFSKNIELKSYFEIDKNRNHFVETISKLKEKKAYRDYYLKALHQLYTLEYKKTTHFISTTTDKNVAYDFAGENGIIIHCWTPKLNPRLFFKKYNLPKIIFSPFKEQFEETIFAGILPHYISAVEILSETKSYINPSIFKNKISERLFTDGLNIDQNEFEEYIIKTKFRKFFTVAGKKISESKAYR
ncbi:hypothetical protein Q4595_16295 [Wenyingzhuangia sp. 1_MG-2023]|nr:hypothetical protein [Wenyingzhuangia sp. 1_MG-2023]